MKEQGIDDQRDYNQIANFAIVEWGDNNVISSAPPSEYVPMLEKRFDAKVLQEMYRHHALPLSWHSMNYEAFLEERRILIAQTIRAAYERLAGKTDAPTPTMTVADLMESGETSVIEFKSTLRTNLHTGEKDARMEMAVLKSIAGFLNTNGGVLIIGVADDGSPVGLEQDGFADEDKMSLHLINLLKDRLGGQHALNVQPRFDEHDSARVLVVECSRSHSPVFVKEGSARSFLCDMVRLRRNLQAGRRRNT